MQDCPSQIAQVVYQGQTGYTRILERKQFMDTSYRNRHRLELKHRHIMELKYFHLDNFC